ncbi:MAG: type II toxin-antitoxin system VapC family toxin [Desulfobacteraceae bacterium]|nr:type II toxin-antitoxin system VapC family toxin [Desulfobacteraceae bacterium]
MRVFFDSSAFAKRYIREEHTDTVLEWCDRAREIALSGIALAEIVAAFCRLLREGKITAHQYARLKTALFYDAADISLCDLTPEVLHYSILRLEACPLRGMDAIHIGSAQVWKPDVFVSADRRQSAAAEGAGLQVVALVSA